MGNKCMQRHAHTMPHYYDRMILFLSPVRREIRLKIDLRNSSNITVTLKRFFAFSDVYLYYRMGS